MNSRDQVLGAVRGALGRREVPEPTVAALQCRLAQPSVNIMPARGRLPLAERIELFMGEVERVSATTVRLSALSEVPAAVMAYLRQANLPAAIRASTNELLETVPWSQEPLLQVGYGCAEAEDQVAVTSAFAGVAETGTLMMVSDARNPVTLNFLPEHHIAILPVTRILGTYEEAWQRLRGVLGNGQMPRAINWITGPSRTADIEQTMLLGAHGPKQLHILLVDADNGRS
ncbi:MAG: lactate utilization protein [Defluviicoccus sp.]|nr:MAG: lactate utilization protein [Defluviicoccus sp.]